MDASADGRAVRLLYVSKALRVAAYRDKLRRLAEHVDITAVVPERWGGQPLEAAADLPGVELLPALMHGHNHFHLYRGMSAVLDSLQPDLVHIDEEPYSVVTAQLVTLCRRRRIPCLFFAWQNLDKRLPPPFGALRRYVYRNAQGAIAGTAMAAGVLERSGFPGSTAVVPQFGVDPARFAPDPSARRAIRERLGVADDQTLVGYGGRLVREKGVGVLLSAFSSLSRCRLVLLGDGPLRGALETSARTMRIADRVHFAGAVPSLEMPRWLAGLDVLVLPSLTGRSWVEQFGRILVEAMACGVAVVASSAGEMPNVVGNAGLVVRENDPVVLAAALQWLMENPATRASLAEEGRLRAVQLFSQDRIARDTVDFYHQLVAGDTTGSRRPADRQGEATALEGSGA